MLFAMRCYMQVHPDFEVVVSEFIYLPFKQAQQGQAVDLSELLGNHFTHKLLKYVHDIQVSQQCAG